MVQVVTRPAPARLTGVLIDELGVVSLELLGADELESGFAAQWARCARVVESLARRSGLDDPDAIVGQTALRAWRAFPRLAATERRWHQMGLVSGHRWESWFGRIAARLVADERRRRESQVRRFGRPAVRRQDVSPDGGAGDVSPADVDEVADPSLLGDPEREAETRERLRVLLDGLGRLTAMQRRIVVAWSRGVSDVVTSREVGVSVAGLRARRSVALVRLRATFRAHRWDIPTDWRDRVAHGRAARDRARQVLDVAASN